MISAVPRFLVAAASSGSGKTTIICALLHAFSSRNRRVAAFKCGPDYIDPMFHKESVGAYASVNLDLFLSNESVVRRLLAENAQGAQLSIIEGVMGFYDGIASTEQASSYAVACATKTPVVLVVDCKMGSMTTAALIKGICTFRPDANIQAFILNRVSAMRYSELKKMIEQECGVPVIGFLPPMPDCSLESRHLGLITASEVDQLPDKLASLAEQAEKTIDLAFLEQLAALAPPILYEPVKRGDDTAQRVVVAVARDAAFCFYYADALQLLEQLGAQLVFFSPLEDACLPACDGLLLGGGYPELYAQRLSENVTMRRSIGAAIADGLPTIAECGGFLYLHRTLEDPNGVAWPMVAVVDADGYKTGKLRRFGYATLCAKQDGLLCRAGELLHAHEFHYWESSVQGEAFVAQKPYRENVVWSCGYHSEALYAGFAHLYFPGNEQAAVRFIAACARKRGEADVGASADKRKKL